MTTVDFPIRLCANCVHLLPNWHCGCREDSDKQQIDCPDWEGKE